MEFFLDHGADIDRRGDDGDTVLAAAVELIGDSLELCMTGKIELVRCLVHRGASTEVRKRVGKAVVEYVRENGSDELLAALLGMKANQ